MILVTGTMRSGSSLWMQILKAAGLPVIGEAFPSVWGESIRDANPNGFYESAFRRGIYFATNPDPKTGQWFPPSGTKRHAVKVFIPGLIRTDFAFLDRVIVTVRHWREYDSSLRRLFAMEDAWMAEKRAERPDDPMLRTTRSPLPPAIDWFLQHYEVLRDAATRRYPVHFCTYDRLLADPAAELGKVVPWLGGGDLEAAVGAVEQKLRSQQRDTSAVEGVSEAEAELFDALFNALHAGGSLDVALMQRLDEASRELEARWRPQPLRDRDHQPVAESAKPA